MRSSLPKLGRISVLKVYEKVGQKSFQFLVGILGETMTSWIHSEFNWLLDKLLHRILFFWVQTIMLCCPWFCMQPEKKLKYFCLVFQELTHMSTVLKIAPATNASSGSRGEKARFYKVERTMIRCTYLLT